MHFQGTSTNLAHSANACILTGLEPGLLYSNCHIVGLASGAPKSRTGPGLTVLPENDSPVSPPVANSSAAQRANAVVSALGGTNVISSATCLTCNTCFENGGLGGPGGWTGCANAYQSTPNNSSR